MTDTCQIDGFAHAISPRRLGRIQSFIRSLDQKAGLLTLQRLTPGQSETQSNVFLYQRSTSQIKNRKNQNKSTEKKQNEYNKSNDKSTKLEIKKRKD